MLAIQRLGQVLYQSAWDLQKEWVQRIDQGAAGNQLLLLEHPHTVTLGRSTHPENLLLSTQEYEKRGVDVVAIDRGGDVTYHGPGQLVGYPLVHLPEGSSAHAYLRCLEEGIIKVLGAWGIQGERKEAYTGVWVGDKKIAAIGVKFNRARIKKGYITSHGFALNVNTDLQYFKWIVPCGITEYEVTSMEQVLGEKLEMKQVMDEISRIVNDPPPTLTLRGGGLVSAP